MYGIFEGNHYSCLELPCVLSELHLQDFLCACPSENEEVDLFLILFRTHRCYISHIKY